MQEEIEQPQEEQSAPVSFWNGGDASEEKPMVADKQPPAPREDEQRSMQEVPQEPRATTRAIARRPKSVSRHDIIKRNAGGPKAIRRYQSKTAARPQSRGASKPAHIAQHAAGSQQATSQTTTPQTKKATAKPKVAATAAAKKTAPTPVTSVKDQQQDAGRIPIAEVASQAAEVASAAGDALKHAGQAVGNAFTNLREAMPTGNDTPHNEKGSFHTSRALRMALPVVGVLLLVYVLGGWYFSAHFPPNTKVNGMDVSGMSVPKLEERVRQIGDAYTLTMDGEGISLKATAADIDLGYDSTQYAQEAAEKANGWAWPITLLFGSELEVEHGITFSEEKLARAVGDAVTWANKTASYPQDATISYDKTAGSYVPVPEVAGTAISEEAATTKASKAVSSLTEQVTLGDEDLLQPSITMGAGDFNKLVAQANELVSLSIPLRIYNTTIATVDKNLISGWLTVNDAYEVVANPEAIANWTRGELSDQVDTVGKVRNYTRPDGKEIQIAGGTYGWSVDGSSLATLIANQIAKKSSDPIDVPMLSEAMTLSKGGPDWGNRYIDVDLTEQYVRMYDSNGDLIWESQCVSGDASQAQDTIMGVFAIEGKESPAKLIGLDYDGDGEPDYETDVNYWMPFCGGYGFHDATWRYDFGGDIFQYEGSHGCINLPFDFAAVLYDLVNIGDPVVVHY